LPKIVCLLMEISVSQAHSLTVSLSLYESFVEKLFILWPAGTPPLTRNLLTHVGRPSVRVRFA